MKFTINNNGDFYKSFPGAKSEKFVRKETYVNDRVLPSPWWYKSGFDHKQIDERTWERTVESEIWTIDIESLEDILALLITYSSVTISHYQPALCPDIDLDHECDR